MEIVFLVSIYLVVINAIGTFLMYSDKRKAVQGKWRIKESTLFSIALIGGSAGIWIGSNRFRHKTHHKSFQYGIPAIMIVQIVLIIFAIYSGSIFPKSGLFR